MSLRRALAAWVLEQDTWWNPSDDRIGLLAGKSARGPARRGSDLSAVTAFRGCRFPRGTQRKNAGDDVKGDGRHLLALDIGNAFDCRCFESMKKSVRAW